MLIVALTTAAPALTSVIEPVVIEVHGDGVAEWAEKRARPVVERLEVSGETAFCYVSDEKPLLESLRALGIGPAGPGYRRTFSPVPIASRCCAGRSPRCTARVRVA